MKLVKALFVLIYLFPGILEASLKDEPEGDYYKVRGTIYARPGEEDIKKLHAKLYLPPRGEGSVFIHIHDYRHNESKTIESLNHFVEREHGRSIFYIVFPYKTEGEIAIMKGSYMRDENLALYSGEIFVAPSESAEESPNGKINFDHDDMRFIGLFSFKDRIL